MDIQWWHLGCLCALKCDVVVKGAWNQVACVQILTIPGIDRVILSQLPSISVPWINRLENGEDNRHYRMTRKMK